MYKSKEAINKEREIYEYLKRAIFSSFAKDEHGLFLIDINPYIKEYQIEYDKNNIPRKILKEINCDNEKIKNKTYYIDGDSRPLDVTDFYGFKTNGGVITLNGDFVPSYFDRDDDPGHFTRIF